MLFLRRGHQKIVLDICCKITYNIYIEILQKIKENTLLEMYIIFAFCMAGCAGHAYFTGRRMGIQNTVEYLMEKGILELDEESPSL